MNEWAPRSAPRPSPCGGPSTDLDPSTSALTGPRDGLRVGYRQEYVFVSFDQLGLEPDLLRAVADQGYTEPTPVQAQAIPEILAGRDVLAGAQTGTGKTAAFVLPILQLLPRNRPTPRHSIGPRPKGASGLPIRCLVLVPTRELALQVEESVRVYGRTRPVRSTAVYGGVGYAAQIDAVRGGPEVLVATPGRLLDYVEQGVTDLSRVEILVLDEADRMLDMGFIRDIRRIIGLLPPRRQNLLFSATFSDDIRELAHSLLRDPVQIQVARRNAPIDLVRQVAIRVDRERKRDLLRELWASGRIDQALVFTRTKHGAGRLAEQLARDGIPAAAIHGDRTQSQRIRALDDFKAGRVDILVATEVAARGLDIEGLPHVVNFELPLVPEDYVHRIGRTGRAGLEGDAISFVSAEEWDLLRDIERLLGNRISTGTYDGFEPRQEAPVGRGGPGSHDGTQVPGRPRSGADRGAGGRGRGSRRPGAHGQAASAAGRSGRRHAGRGSAPVGHAATSGPNRAAPHAQPAPHGDGRGHATLPGERFSRRGPAAG